MRTCAAVRWMVWGLAGLATGAPAAESALDGGFNTGGFRPGWRVDFFNGNGSNNDQVAAIRRTPDGSLIAAGPLAFSGGTGIRIGLVKYRPDGTLDPNFGSGGKVVKDAFLSSVTDMVLDSQGRIVVVGATPTGTGGNLDFGIVRFLPNGQDDPSFAGDGGTAIGFNYGGTMDDRPTSVVVDDQNRPIVFGTIMDGLGKRVSGAARFTTTGEPDTTFGNMGVTPTGRSLLRIGNGTYEEQAARIVRMPNGSLVVSATVGTSATGTAFGLSLVSPEGRQTSSPQNSVIFSPRNYPATSVTSLAIHNNRSVIVAGNSPQTSDGLALLCRFTIGGQFDTDLFFDVSFGPNCHEPFNVTSVQDLAVRSNRGVVYVGYSSGGGIIDSAASVFRLTPSGTADEAFESNGGRVYLAPCMEANQSAYATRFLRITLAGDQPVAAGYSSRSCSSDIDREFAVMRLQKTDLIFANDFQ
ncbi:hypothetical protein [Tahibacter amnicola]|uniref:Delta-60 repeat protein n=1 Tax=Tahibacter amnicola TaxID=2976241 RepID=A0ABY6BCY9_9GAMM|nr:hypothetical protein [Tahibacter amnicola]UXI67908.1 hypothetical protein N4264_24795 [Tahibacter amnicola]